MAAYVGTLTAQGTQTWSGTGSILFGGNTNNYLAVPGGTTLTLGAGLTVHGQSGFVGTPDGGAFINEGTISARPGRPAGGQYGGGNPGPRRHGLEQSGKLEVSNNETLVADGTGWSNTGSFTINAATLDIGSINGGGPGSVTTAGLGIFAPAPASSFSRTGGTVNLTGTLDNTGSTLPLDSRTGAWNVVGGTIIGGTITTSGAMS